MNGGTCTDLVYKYSCTCTSQWAGGHCGVETDPCTVEENDCDKKFAKCVHIGAGSHECVCHAGYETTESGKTCTNILECASSPCMNSHMC